MKNLVLIITALLAFNTTNAQLLGSLTTKAQGGVMGKTQTLSPQIGFCEKGQDLNEETMIFQDVVVTLAKSALTYNITAENENFDNFVAQLTNDKTAILKVGYKINRIKNHVGMTPQEWFETDFADKKIGRIELIIDEVDFATPGTNRTGDDNWTDFFYEITINVYGTDELMVQN
ncbi:MAG: hypothetical protein AB8G11_25340 [Saprospiraceae bacterium]